MTDYITVVDWDKFQHHDVAKNKIRAPSWIRVYTELHKNESYLALSGNRRAILHGIWIEYAASRRRLPDDTATIARRIALKVTRADLVALSQAGFIECCHDTVTTLSGPKEKRVDETKAVLSVLPGGKPDDADSLSSTFDNILKGIE